MATYEWGNKFQLTEGAAPSGSTTLNSYDVDVNAIGEEIKRIAERDGVTTPSAMLESGRSPESPHYDCLEWHDPTAADKYRLSQCSLILRTINIVNLTPDGEKKGHRAFISVVDPRDPDSQKKGYIHVLKANDDDFEYVIRRYAMMADSAANALEKTKRAPEEVEMFREVNRSLLKKIEPRQLATA